MKPNTRWSRVIATTAVVCCTGIATHQASGQDSFQAQERAATTARAKDPAWKPSCSELSLIQIGSPQRPGALRNFCLNAEGNILACFAPSAPDGSVDAPPAPAIRVYSPAGELLKTLPLEIKPGAIAVAKDGAIFVAGDGRLLKLDSTGGVLASARSPVAEEPVVLSEEIKEMLKETGRSTEEELNRMKLSLESRRSDVTGLAVTGEDVFIAVPAPSDFTYRVYRFDHALTRPKLVVEKLRGCCGQMDIQGHDGKLWIPHNARHSVECRDRDGNELAKFGKAGKVKASDFGGCCEPKNLRVLPNGEILVAESGPPTCIKRFSASGRFIEVVALLETRGDCVRVTVEQSPDGTRYYMLDTTRDAIRVFGKKS
jgi:hypothetical protein